MHSAIRAVALSATLSAAVVAAPVVVGAAQTDGRLACLSANTMATVWQVDDREYFADVSRAEWSGSNEPTFVESSAVSITATPVKEGVKVAWSPADSGVRQLGGAVQTSSASGYTGKFLSTKTRKYTVTLKKGTDLDFVQVCFDDTDHPPVPATPGSVSPATRRSP